MAFITNHLTQQISTSIQNAPIVVDSPSGVQLPVTSALTFSSTQNNIGFADTTTVTPITLLSDTSGSTTSIVFGGRLHFYKSGWKSICENVDLEPIRLHSQYSLEISATSVESRVSSLESRDQIPVGAIFYWSGSSVPSNFALCNGQVHNSVQTPDLRNRFILCKNSITDASTTGGQSSVQLTDSNLPDHNHIIPWGEHYKVGGEWGYYGGPNNHGTKGKQDYDNYWYYTSPAGNASIYGVDAHNNIPPFFTLAYIMYTG